MNRNALERIIARPHTDRTPAHWFFKTSEGLMGPFDSHETAMEMLQTFVAKCKEAIRTEAEHTA